MAAPPTLAALRDEYLRLFADATTNSGKTADVLQAANQILANRARYEQATATISMPWWVAGLMHMRESDFDFRTHLHNGDRLTARTVQVPANRPAANPQANSAQPPSAANPYTWEESAVDAIAHDGLSTWTDWSLAGTLFKLEAFNGFGYRMYHPTVLSPYLWSATSHYTKGKYASDGNFDANLVDQQLGVAPVMAVMFDNGTAAPPNDLTQYVAKRGANAAIDFLNRNLGTSLPTFN